MFKLPFPAIQPIHIEFLLIPVVLKGTLASHNPTLSLGTKISLWFRREINSMWKFFNGASSHCFILGVIFILVAENNSNSNQLCCCIVFSDIRTIFMCVYTYEY